MVILEGELGGLVVLVIVAGLYFFPTIVAKSRHVENAAPTFIVNLFFGWTLVGWVIALAMGAGARTGARAVALDANQVVNQMARPATPLAATAATSDLERLADLHTRGVLTDDEFSAKKKQVLGL